MRVPFQFTVRRLRRGEEEVHAPRGRLRDDCYLGTKVHVLNVYERCGHACAYCYSEWPWSPREVVVRTNLVGRVRRDLARRYVGRRVVLNLGSATDPYQPVEGKFRFMRRIIPLLKEFNASFYICTKSSLILRDLDLLKGYEACWVAVSLASLDEEFAEVFEPGAARPRDRLRVVERLLDEGIFTVVRISPILPFISDGEMLDELVRALKALNVRYVTADILKLDRRGYILSRSVGEGRPSWKRSLAESLRAWQERRRLEINLEKAYLQMFYREGENLHGWMVPQKGYRLKVLGRLRELCHPEIKFSVCAMGVDLRNALTTWIGDDHTYRCSCLAREPTIISPPGRD